MRSSGALLSTSLIAALMVSAASGPAFALDVDEAHWGFGGQVVEKRFNLVSVLVRNNTPNPFDGDVAISRRMGASAVDVPVAETVFLAPFSARWVQFAAYCPSANDPWTVSWGRRASDRVPLPQTAAGRPARVFLVPADDFAARSVGYRRFPDNLFPPAVTMTDGLASVALGHVPRWEASRRRAFLDWIGRGGMAHLIPDSAGKPLRFPAELLDLNNPADEFRIGSGRVFRHSVDRSKLTAEVFEQRERPWRTLASPSPSDASGAGTKTPENGADAQPGHPAEGTGIDAGNEGGSASAATNDPNVGSATAGANAAADVDLDPNAGIDGNGWMRDDWVSDAGSRILDQIKPLARAEHNWLLIYLMAMVYLGVIFPGLYLFGQRKIDPRMVYGALLGVVALFSVSFGWVGRRGYGESTSVHMATIARALPAGGWDVSAWGNLFVRDGDVYRFALPGIGGSYATGQDLEAVNGVARTGAEPQLLLDMPLYSARTFVARTRADKLSAEFKLKEPPVALGPGGANGIGGRLSVSVEYALPAAAKLERAVALFGKSVYDLSLGSNRLECRGQPGAELDDWLRQQHETWNSRVWGGPFDSESKTPDQRYSEVMPMLVARSLDLTEAKDRLRIRLPDDRVRLFVYATLDDGLRAADPRFANQSGRTLYVVDLFSPESKPAAP